MITFYLVDDEDTIREGMQYYFPWNQYDAQVIGSAVNGAAALPEILEKQPDVVFTDVVMPKMDGLRLAKNLRKMGFTGEIVFLSAYQEMEYVKAAFKCGAADFLFKPIQTEEMDATIREIVARVQHNAERQALLADAQAAVNERETTRITGIWSCFLHEGQELPPAFAAGYAGYFVLLVHFPAGDGRWYLQRWRAELSSAVSVLCRLDEPDVVCFVVAQSTEAMVPLSTCAQILAQQLKRRLGPYVGDVPVFIGQVTTDFHQLPQSYGTAARQLAEYLVCGHEESPRLLSKDESAGFSPREPWGEQVGDLLLSGRTEELHAALREYFRTLAVASATDLVSMQNSCAVFCFSICAYLEKNVADELLTTFTKEVARVTHLKTFSEIHQGLEAAVLDLKRQLAAEEGSIRTVQRVKALVEQHPEKVGASVLAEQLNLSKNYLATLFKRHTGRTLNDYITGVRLEKAAQRLQNGGCYVYEVATELGYKDIAYFSRLFKQQYGCTPADYKEKNEAGGAAR